MARTEATRAQYGLLHDDQQDDLTGPEEPTAGNRPSTGVRCHPVIRRFLRCRTFLRPATSG